jgi:hypothetical protein
MAIKCSDLEQRLSMMKEFVYVKVTHYSYTTTPPRLAGMLPLIRISTVA